MPSRSRPWRLARRSRTAAPSRRRAAARRSVSSSSLAETVLPTWTLQWKMTPSASICFTRRVDDALLHLEVGDAVAQQAAGLGALLVDVHVMAGARELLGGGEPGRARSRRWRCACRSSSPAARARPSLPRSARSAMAHSIALDGHRHVIDVERAGGLARRRAHAARHLGEVVGRVQVLRRLLPVGVIDEVVPVGDLVVDRAAGVTIGDAAVHAAGWPGPSCPPRSAPARTRANASRAPRRARTCARPARTRESP